MVFNRKKPSFSSKEVVRAPLIKFQRKLVSKIRELREEKKLSQLELAKLLEVTRQTVYFFEIGRFTPKLTNSFKISDIFKKPIEEIFYFEPIIKDIIGGKKLEELEEIAEKVGVPFEKLLTLRKTNDDEILKHFNQSDLEKISKALGLRFEDLFKVE